MRHCLSLAMVFCAVALVVMTPSAPPVEAYPAYSADKVSHPPGSSRCRTTDTEGCEESFGYCKSCHGHFRATDETNSRPMLRDEYVSPVDGKTWREVYTEVTETEPVLRLSRTSYKLRPVTPSYVNLNPRLH